MNPETEPQPVCTIEIMQPDDAHDVIMTWAQAWRDAYTNEAEGVDGEWIEQKLAIRQSPENIAAFKERIRKSDGITGCFFVAKDIAGKVIGLATPYIEEGGVQRVGSLYIDKEYYGRGVAQLLMDRVIEWADETKPLTLGVATYNGRAKAFYRKYGFEDIPDSSELAYDKIPIVRMIRKGTNDEI